MNINNWYGSKYAKEENVKKMSGVTFYICQSWICHTKPINSFKCQQGHGVKLNTLIHFSPGQWKQHFNSDAKHDAIR